MRRSSGHWIRAGAVITVIAGGAALVSPAAEPPPSPPPPSLLQQALAGPLRDVDEVVFCTRSRYDDGHWYANIGYYCDDANRKAYAGNGRPDDGKLYRLNLHTGAVAVLFDAQGGSVRDPQVHYDGRKILFSYRKAGTDYYHLHEINVDGSGLTPLTAGDFDDYEPTYLPDGDIAFVSTRCNRWVNCWYTQVGIIYRCDGQGRNLRQISANTEHDNTPWVMPDGRLIYMRWEYVDRSQVEYHALWAMNPDGTGQAIYFGNMHSWTVMIDAKPIPGTDQVVAAFSPGHGVNEHAGIATILSPHSGPDDQSVPRPLHGGRLTKDPYPLSADCFLLARDKELVLMDSQGHEQVIYAYPGEGGVNEPRPIMPRPRELVVRPRTNPSQPTGRMVLADVYRGRNLQGVKRGEVRKLLVLESLPKPVNFSGGPDLVSWLGTFTLERVLGTVPVEADGSAYFEVPANRQVFFASLDEKDLAVKRMQSWCSVGPGETISCVGCHEQRTETPRQQTPGTLLALGRPPSRIEPFTGLPDVLDFNRDIQPILDQHCVKCHDYTRPDGHLILAGDFGPAWSHSFFSLFARRQVADGRNGLGNQPPRTIGSSASRLLQLVDGSHYDVNVTPQEWRTLWLWIESGATYVGSYAGLRNTRQQELANGATAAVFTAERDVLRRRCASCHSVTPDVETAAKPLPYAKEWNERNKQLAGRPTGAYERVLLGDDPIARYSVHILLNFTRPELSPLLLAPLAKVSGGLERCGAVFRDQTDPDYQAILGGLQAGKSLLDSEPRYGTPGFRPNPQYVREMQKYAILPATFDLTKSRLDVFQTDQSYWKSFWYQPAANAAK